MVRTQIYLTEHQRNALAVIAGRTGRKQSELIREAVDRYIAQTSGQHRETLLREAAGVWRERTDLADYEELRAEWDRC